MNRYIVVQTARTALFGAFSTSASDITAAAIASLDKCVRDDMGGRLSLDTSFDKRDAVNGGALAVYRVPADFPAYVEAEVSAHDVESGRTFEAFEDFDLVGALVADPIVRSYWINATILGGDADDLAVDFTVDTQKQDLETALEAQLEAVRDRLRDMKVRSATLLLSDYTTDEEGETVSEETFRETYEAA